MKIIAYWERIKARDAGRKRYHFLRDYLSGYEKVLWWSSRLEFESQGYNIQSRCDALPDFNLIRPVGNFEQMVATGGLSLDEKHLYLAQEETLLALMCSGVK